MPLIKPALRSLLILLLTSLTASCSPPPGAGTGHAGAPGPPIALDPEATIPPPAELREARQHILELVDSGEVPSMAVAVARGGEVIWQEAFGFADRERKIPATPGTTYALGSLSKSILATGIMILADKGRLRLDTPVNTILGEGWLRNPHGDTNAATVLDVLAMRAGVPHGWTSYADQGSVPRGLDARKAYFGAILFSAFPPGKVFEYSNFSYGVGELVIEATTGLPIDGYLEQALFAPLGMRNSSAESLPRMAGTLATGYDASGAPLPRFHNLPGGGLGYFSSAHDLLRYGLFHLGLRVGKSEEVMSVSSRERMQRFENIPPNLFHLGWWGDEHGYVSNGSISGANSHLKIFPEERLVIVVLMNRTGFQADQAADEIAAALVPGEAERSAEARKAYMDSYERPYREDSGLAGRWEGLLDPAGRAIRLSLVLDSGVHLTIGTGESMAPDEITTSILGGIRISLDPGRLGLLLAQDSLDRARMILSRQDEDLVGYLSLISGDDTKSTSLPLFVRLSKRE